MPDVDHSNNTGGHRESFTKSPVPRYIPSPREEEHSTQVVNGSEPAPDPPAQERLYPRSHEAQESAAVMAVDGLDPFPQIPAFQHPVNRITRERNGSLSLDGYGQDSRGRNSTNGISNRQRVSRPRYGRSLCNWRRVKMAEAPESFAKDLFPINSHTMAGPEVRCPLNHSPAARPAMNHGPRHDSSFTASNGVPRGGIVFRPAQRNTAQLPNIRGPYQGRRMRVPPLREVLRQPSRTDFADLASADRRYPLPGTTLTLSSYKPRQGQCLEERVAGCRPPIQIPGPTEPLGPPLKPFDDPEAEAIAQEQWRAV